MHLKSTTGCPIPNHPSKYTNSSTQAEWVVVMNRYVHIYMHITTINVKGGHDIKGSKEEYMVGGKGSKKLL